jgi:hypothetical protein
MAAITDEFVTRNGCIMTCDGVLFDVLNPTVESIKLDVIAHGLAKKDRASGHYHRVWSVAEHSLFAAYAAGYYASVANMSIEEIRRCAIKALLHDGSEAYLVDLPRPIKHLHGFEEYRGIEANLQDCIYQWGGFFDSQYDDIVHRADNEVLKCEFSWWLNGSERLEWTKNIDVKMVQYVQARWPEMMDFRDWQESRNMFADTFNRWNRLEYRA